MGGDLHPWGRTHPCVRYPSPWGRTHPCVRYPSPLGPHASLRAISFALGPHASLRAISFALGPHASLRAISFALGPHASLRAISFLPQKGCYLPAVFWTTTRWLVVVPLPAADTMSNRPPISWARLRILGIPLPPLAARTA